MVDRLKGVLSHIARINPCIVQTLGAIQTESDIRRKDSETGKHLIIGVDYPPTSLTDLRNETVG